ncbi:MAG: hypothetical protein EA359_07615 [Balneolaceae bacterium]|nr:MAG: hypothetical protein EA359_07615 [Balneolaceae bacterium]
MSKQEILSWTSFITSLSVIVIYVIFVFGWPAFIPDYSGNIFKLFFNLFWIAVGIEIFVDAADKKFRVSKDELDLLIEARGMRNGYYFLSAAVILLLFQMFLSEIFTNSPEAFFWFSNTKHIFHFLFIVLLSSALIKRATQIYFYRAEF